MDLSVLEKLPSKKFMVGAIELGAMEIETPEAVADRIRAALEVSPPIASPWPPIAA